ncbi:MAG: right-handed parallel beta-helix repeat-containing protein [Thermoplasmata archaeon]|nr:right-handed parallel beta-helix repeat-containing protein [Thermoplasmata archaeon]
MRKASFVVAFAVFLLSFHMTVEVLPQNATADTVYVGGTGPGNYSTIQGAIDASDIGDTLHIYSGTYFEHIVVGKALTLIGENRDTTIIDGSDAGPIINVTADWVNISGFNITNGGVSSKTGGIVLHHSQNCYIADNLVSGNGNGMWLTYASYNTISGNHVFMNMWDGIELYPSSNDNTIIGNTIHDNWFGVGVWYSNSNVISSNDIYSEFNMVNDDHAGVAVGYSNDNTIANNSVSEQRTGISLHDSDNNIISGNSGFLNRYAIDLFRSNNTIIDYNTVYDNSNGISIIVSNNNTISDNVIYSNSYGLQIESSSGNKIYHNEFTDNLDQAYDHNGTNQWDNGYPSGGNYWSDYSAYDWFSGPNQNELAGDGIGDSPRQIEAGSCKDRYPILVRPSKSIFNEIGFWIAVILVLVLVALAVFFFKRRKKKEEEPDKSSEEEFENEIAV